MKNIRNLFTVLLVSILLVFSFPLSVYSDTYINVKPFYDIVTSLTDVSSSGSYCIMYRIKSTDEYYLYVGQSRRDIFTGNSNIGLSHTIYGNYYLYLYNLSSLSWELQASKTNCYATNITISSYSLSDIDFCWALRDYDIYDSSQAVIVQTVKSDDSYYNASTGECDSSKIPSGSEVDNNGSGYDDTNLLNRIKEHFEILYNILLYGNKDGTDQDTSELEDNKSWLGSVNDNLTEFTVYLNQAPDVIENGFTAVTNAQEGINFVVSGLNSYVKPLYYGLVGIIVIIVIRKIIGR